MSFTIQMNEEQEQEAMLFAYLLCLSHKHIKTSQDSKEGTTYIRSKNQKNQLVHIMQTDKFCRKTSNWDTQKQLILKAVP